MGAGLLGFRFWVSGVLGTWLVGFWVLGGVRCWVNRFWVSGEKVNSER